MYKGSLSERGR